MLHKYYLIKINPQKKVDYILINLFGDIQNQSFSAKEAFCSENLDKPSTMRANSPRGLKIYNKETEK
tara:strand:- start:168 stop:368 length:201 start_codon:yes stop_codon:yes gene_type:complete